MDRALKERVIGAIVLVLFVVLVVPVFLDGPPEETEIVTESVPLPGQAARESRTVVLDRDRETPVPAVVPVPTASSAAEPGPDGDEPGSAPASEPAASIASEPARQVQPPVESAGGEAASSPTGMWAVQLGSFGERENAERLAAELRKQGFAAFLSQLSTGGGQLHRVRVGPQKDRQSAEAMAARLGKAGHEGQVVPHP